MQFSSCSFIPQNNGPVRDYYVLEVGNRSEAVIPFGNLDFGRIEVADILAPEILNSNRIVFEKSPLTRGYYQLAFWAEPLPRRLTNLFVKSIEDSKIYSSVGKQASAVAAQQLLNCELLDFHHKIVTSPGSVEIGLRCELVNVTNRTLITSKTFRVSTPAESGDSLGAVKAFQVGTSQIIDQLILWLARKDQA